MKSIFNGMPVALAMACKFFVGPGLAKLSRLATA